MTILVTGATGAVGARLVDRLVAEGREPRVASRRLSALLDRWPELAAVELDVLRPATIRPALQGVTAAYYLVHSMEPAAAGDFRERDAEGRSPSARLRARRGRARDLPGWPRQGRRGALRASREPSRDGPHPRRGWSARARVPSCDGRERRQRLVHDADRSREPAPGDGGAPLGRHALAADRRTMSSATSWRGWRRRSTVTALSWRSGDPT